MARRKRHEEHTNHESWAIPYGDLVTLLLAFFVVMYAMSSVNEGKYRILSDSLVAAFRAAPKSMEPIQVGDLSRSLHEIRAQQTRTLVPLEIESFRYEWEDEEALPLDEFGLEYMRGGGLSPEDLHAAEQMIEKINEAITEQLAELVDQDLVRIRHDRFWLEIEINTNVLFESASAQLAEESVPILMRVSEILAGTGTRVQVEGHTDVLPIRTSAFPSNWELSAARAATVVRLFAANGMVPEHLAALGFGEYRPVSDNATATGRQQNRRVVIVVMARQNELVRDAWAGVDEPAPAPVDDGAVRGA